MGARSADALLRAGGRQGEAFRYLAEIVWVPHAILANPELEWRDLGAGTAEVAARVGPARVAVRLDVDVAGDVTRAYAPTRPRRVGGRVVETPWGGTFGDHDVVGGVRIPTWAEVGWELPEGPFTYWRGRITSLDLR